MGLSGLETGGKRTQSRRVRESPPLVYGFTGATSTLGA
jgi:hypothetical protein